MCQEKELELKKDITKDIKDLQFSEREEQIIRLVWDGYTKAEIGEELKISVRTAEVYMGNVYKKVSIVKELRNNSPVCLVRFLLEQKYLKV